MARPLFLEILRGYAFHLIVIPKGWTVSDMTILLPFVGFQTISMAEMSVNVESINEGNLLKPTRHPIGIGEGSITLTRGATFYNSDFYSWILKVVKSKVDFRRDVLLIQYFPAKIDAFLKSMAGAVGIKFGSGGAPTKLDIDISDTAPMLFRTPARVWYLSDCFPIRYKPGGDLDANSSELQITELELVFEDIQEYSGGDAIAAAVGLI